MVLTRSQTRTQREQQATAAPESPSSQRTRRRVAQSSSSRRTEASKRRPQRSRKRRREPDDSEETKQPEKKQKRLDKEEHSVLGMALLSELVCPVCTEIVSGPVTLRCGHSFCYICICKHIDARYPNVQCPLCRLRIENNYEPKVSILFENAIGRWLSSCLFEDSLDKKTYQTRQSEFVEFKRDREENPPDRQPCQCPSCRRNRGETFSAAQAAASEFFYRFPVADEDESDEEMEEPMGRRGFFDFFDYPAFGNVRNAGRLVSDSRSSVDVEESNGVRNNRSRSESETENIEDDHNVDEAESQQRYPFRRTAARRRRRAQ